MRAVQALLGSCFISICCTGYSAAQDAFFPLSEQSIDAGEASAAPKVLLRDIASPIPAATEHRMRGAHEIELFKKNLAVSCLHPDHRCYRHGFCAADRALLKMNQACVRFFSRGALDGCWQVLELR